LKTHNIDRKKIILAVLSGLLLTGSFPRTGIYWFAWFAFIPLLVSLRNLSPKDAFRLGFLTGLTHYLTLLYWLTYTMKTYGNLPLYVSVAIMIIISAYLALYIAVFSITITWICEKPLICIFMIPVLWVSLEYGRSFFLSGSPWELLGYSQFKTLHLIQISDIFGVYGVSFLIALSNAAIFMLFLYLTGMDWKGIKVAKRLAGGSILTFAIIIGLVFAYGKWRIQSIDELISVSQSTRVTVVQGNIEQSKKWDSAFRISTIEKYFNLSLSAKEHKPDLVVWPETAAPFYFFHNIRLSKMVQKGIQNAGTSFLIGIPSFIQSENGIKYYNSAYLINPDGKVQGKYDKVHLVPFGEYVPFKKWLPFLGKMVEEVGDFWPGEKGSTIKWGNYKLGVQICFEIIFPGLSRAVVNNNAALLVNLTNDAWYGNSSAPYQHFSMTVFRAIENRKALVRSANTGISGFIDPVGRIIAETALFSDAVLTRSVPIIFMTTFYTRFGDLFAIACLVSVLFIVLRQKIKDFILTSLCVLVP